MRIKLQAQRHDDQPFEVIKSGDVLTVNGETFDFSPMPDGSTLPASAISSPWFISTVDKQAGEITLTMILPVPANFSPEQANPVDLVAVADGLVVFPPPLPEPEPQTEQRQIQEAAE